MPRFWSCCRNLVHRDRIERDLEDELRAVHDLLTDEKIQWTSAGRPAGEPAGATAAERAFAGYVTTNYFEVYVPVRRASRINAVEALRCE